MLCLLSMPMIPMKRGILNAAPTVWSIKNLITVFLTSSTCSFPTLFTSDVFPPDLALMGFSTSTGLLLGKVDSSQSCQAQLMGVLRIAYVTNCRIGVMLMFVIGAFWLLSAQNAQSGTLTCILLIGVNELGDDVRKHAQCSSLCDGTEY